MGKITGFLEYGRKNGPETAPEERIGDFREFRSRLSLEEQRIQAARCMDCGVPFCQAGVMISGMASGCPLNNLVPEINDLVYHGNLDQAYQRLTKTHCFPEFTSRVCPALCEAACTCGTFSDPVSTKENEKAVIEYAFEHGLVSPDRPKTRTGKKIAVVGSGPSGLAAAQLLNKRGHSVTVYERSDRAGGLLRYGIPNMKLDKSVIDRRLGLMEEAGVTFRCGVNVGIDIAADELMDNYDRVILACGASNPRDIKVPGREADGIFFAVDFLKKVTKTLLDGDFKSVPYELARDKNVLVVGGGDTGNDCVGTVIRLGAKSVMQLEMMPEPPKERLAGNPWPEWPRVLKTDYGQEEAVARFGHDPRLYKTTVSEFIKDDTGKVKAAEIVSLGEDRKPVEGSRKRVPADLVLIAAGFLGCESYVAEAFGAERNERTNIKTAEGSFKTGRDRLFAAGDMRRGQSLVVWAIAEGSAAAREVEESLLGYSNL